jgi:hypothetical protein
MEEFRKYKSNNIVRGISRWNGKERLQFCPGRYNTRMYKKRLYKVCTKRRRDLYTPRPFVPFIPELFWDRARLFMIHTSSRLSAD